MIRRIVLQGESEIRAEFSKLDADNSGYITKGGDQSRKTFLKAVTIICCQMR